MRFPSPQCRRAGNCSSLQSSSAARRVRPVLADASFPPGSFGRPVHSWVTVTPAERSAAGLGLESGVKSHAILGGRRVLSGAALRCGTLAGAQTLQEELRPLMDWQV